MEENVALDSTRQNKFIKSIKEIKKLIKTKGSEENADESGKKIKKGRVFKKKRNPRGLVYLGHIPHGFYENEMTQYFKQFGVVTNARVIKSKTTGRSKGYAFVEFKDPAVAEIVAETMNNYLMGKRLIKAFVIPPEKQRRAFRKKWNSGHCPGHAMMLATKKSHNEDRDEKGELLRAKKLLANVNRTIAKLRELGINYDFFAPVDVPEALVQDVNGNFTTNDTSSKKQANKDTKPVVKIEDNHVNVKKNDTKNKKKGKKEVVEDSKASIKEEVKDNHVNVKKNQSNTSKKKSKKEVVGELLQINAGKDSDHVINKKEQKSKNKTLKSKGIEPMENFIKIEQNSEEDSDLGFDSDEYEKLLYDDDDSDGFDEDSHGESDDESASEDDVEIPIQKSKNNTTSKLKIPVPKVQRQIQKVLSQPEKRKAISNEAVQPIALSKKPKFEKQSTQKPRDNRFKKKGKQ